MIEWLHELPLTLGAIVVSLIFLVPTLIGSAVVQPSVARLLRREKDPNSLVGLLLNSFTLYYGVLLALLSIAVFDNYGKAQDAIGREASSLFALYRDVSSYPDPMRSSMRELLRNYAQEATGPGWRDQESGRVSAPESRIVRAIGTQLLSYEPNRQTGEDLLHREILRTYGEFIERRGIRIQAAGTNIPLVIWYVVLVGAVLNVFVLWLFDLRRTTHFIIGGVLTLFIGLVIYMVAVLDRPFRHGLQPDALIQAREQMAIKTSSAGVQGQRPLQHLR